MGDLNSCQPFPPPVGPPAAPLIRRSRISRDRKARKGASQVKNVATPTQVSDAGPDPISDFNLESPTTPVPSAATQLIPSAVITTADPTTNVPAEPIPIPAVTPIPENSALSTETNSVQQGDRPARLSTPATVGACLGTALVLLIVVALLLRARRKRKLRVVDEKTVDPKCAGRYSGNSSFNLLKFATARGAINVGTARNGPNEPSLEQNPTPDWKPAQRQFGLTKSASVRTQGFPSPVAGQEESLLPETNFPEFFAPSIPKSATYVDV